MCTNSSIRVWLSALVAGMALSVGAQGGSSSAESNVTTVDTRDRPIAVSGRVLDAATRAPIGGAAVSLAGQNTTTASSGQFGFAAVARSGGSTLVVSKSGYPVHTETLAVPAGVNPYVVPDVVLQPGSGNQPVVTGIRPKYDGLFLSGASILNEYTATVNWNGKTPKSVEFYVNDSSPQIVATTGTEATADIDMALGFYGSLTLGANRVSAVAVSTDGTRSAAFDQPVTVLPMPLFLVNQAMLLPFELIPRNQPSISWEFNFPRSFLSARDVKKIPFIGDFGPDFNFDVAFDYKVLTGEWGLFAGKEWDKRLHYRAGRRPNSTPLHPKFYFGNVDFKWAFGGKAEGVASQTRGIVVERVGAQLSAGVRMEILSFYFTDYVPGGQLVRLLDHLKGLGIDVNSIQRVRVDGLFDAKLSALLKFPSLEFDRAKLNLTPGVEAVYEPSVWVAHGSIAVGGNLGFDLELAPRFGMDEITAAIYMRLHFEAWLMKDYDEKFVILGGTIYQRPPAGQSLLGARGQAAKPLLGSTAWAVYRVVSDAPPTLRRDYLAAGPEQFVASGPRSTPRAGAGQSLEEFRQLSQVPVKGSVMVELETPTTPAPPGLGGTKAVRDASGEGPGPSQADLTLVTNCFPNSSPALASRTNELLLLYVGDNGSPNALQFTDIRWTRWDGTNWSAPQTMETNTQAEFAPQVAYEGNGDAIAVWERVADPDFNQTNLTAMAAQMEIVWSKWRRTTGAWSKPLALTTNSYLDHAPLLCGPMADGSVLAVWTRNYANLLMGTGPVGGDENDRVMWSKWNPATQGWSAPLSLLSDLPYRLSQSLAGAGDRAVYAWSRDVDGVLTNATDQQVFCCQFQAGAWGPATQFTADAAGNRNTRVAVAPAGQIYLVWQQETNLVLSTNFSASVSLVRADSQTAGFADYAMTIGPQGNLVLLWQEMSQAGSDAHYMVYDPASGTWSQDDLLCNDPPLERSFAPVWDNLGNLTVAYNKVEMLRTNVTVTLEGGGSVTITNVPQPSRVDLVVTKRALVKDLALLAGDFTVQGLNYLPGDPLTLSAVVRNVGNVAMSNAVVSFFDGNPDTGGTLFTNVTLTGWLEAASASTATAQWIVPEPAAPHLLYAVVNRSALASEYDGSNNARSLSIGGTDLSVSLVSYRAETNGAVRVIAQVQNLGAPTAANSALAIRWEGQTNAPLATVDVPSLEPGCLAQVALDLPAGTQPEGEAVYRLFADETKVTQDVDRSNNTTSFAVNLWVDSDSDGVPDAWMQKYFGHATGLETDQSRALDDADGDGFNNLAEYLAGTDPQDAYSYLRVASIIAEAGDTSGVRLAWGSAAGHQYAIERTTAVGTSFATLVQHLLATPPENVFLDTSATNSATYFYRLKVE
jgi:hypothetical protein